MNKQLFYKISISIIGGFLLIWLAAFTVYLSSSTPSPPPEQAQTPAPSPAPPQTVRAQPTLPDTQQTVKNAKLMQYEAIIQNGEIAIYEIYTNGCRQLYTVLEDIDIRLLRAQDRERFAKGITLYSLEDVASLIEDFSS